jgi:outer membrane immunogenic protein
VSSKLQLLSGIHVCSSIIFYRLGITRDGGTAHGWFIGGGYEYAFNWLPGLFWKTEYRFSEFDRQLLAVRFADGDGAYGVDSKKRVQTITTSLVWRFNFLGGAPVAARY